MAAISAGSINLCCGKLSRKAVQAKAREHGDATADRADVDDFAAAGGPDVQFGQEALAHLSVPSNALCSLRIDQADLQMQASVSDLAALSRMAVGVAAARLERAKEAEAALAIAKAATPAPVSHTAHDLDPVGLRPETFVRVTPDDTAKVPVTGTLVAMDKLDRNRQRRNRRWVGWRAGRAWTASGSAPQTAPAHPSALG